MKTLSGRPWETMTNKKKYSKKKKNNGASRSLLMKRAKRRKIKRKQTGIFNQPLVVRLLNKLLIKRGT